MAIIMYQLVFEPTSRLNIDTSVYSIVAQHIHAVENVPFIFNLVAKPHIVAHAKLYELEHMARKIPQLYSYSEICSGDKCSNGFYFYARLDFVRVNEPPSNCGKIYDFRYLDFLDGSRVYWDAFVMEDVEEMDASNSIARSVNDDTIVY